MTDGSRDTRDLEDVPPMLVLGEDQPDVEDTTPEELERQRQELEARRRRLEEEDRRRREEAEAEAARLHREAEAKLAEERRQAEVELARRQREIDDAERRLVRTERRIRKKAQETGTAVPDVASTLRGRTRGDRSAKRIERLKAGSLLAAVEHRSGLPVPRMPLAATLAVAAAAMISIGAATSVDPPSPAEVEEFVTADETRVTWLDAATTLDDEVVRYLAGEDVAQPDGSLASVTLAQEASLTSDGGYSLRDFEEGLPPLLAEQGTNPQRVLSAWVEARQAGEYAVTTTDVDRAGEELDTGRAFPTLLLLGGIVAVGGLAFSLGRGGTRVGAGLAGLALVPAALLAVHPDRHLGVDDALAQHEEVLDDAGVLFSLVGRDLQVLYGTRALDSYEQDEYWVGVRYLDEDVYDPETLQAYADAREAVLDVDTRALGIEESLPYAAALVETGTAALDAQHEKLADARAEVLASTEPDLDVGPYVGLTAAAALLPLAALVPAAMRRRKVER